MPELLRASIGISGIAGGSLLLGLLVGIKLFTEKFGPTLCVWMISLILIVGGIYQVLIAV